MKRISTQVAVVLRIGVSCLIAFSLSIADTNVVPEALAFLVGLVGVTLTLILPTLMFVFGAVLPSFTVTFVLAMLASSMLLCAATVSDGLFVTIFSIYTILMTTLYGGETYQKTSGMVSTLVAIGGLLAISYRPVVQKGGSETVRLMWTESGLDNSKAVYRNILIALCWAYVAVIVSRSLPPFRTSRSLISRTVLPGIFHQLVALLNGDLEDTSQLVHVWNKLDSGSIAKMTLFEPILNCRWTQDLVTPLQDLVLKTDALILDSFVAITWKKQDAHIRTESLDKATMILNACASALSSNDPEQIQILKDLNEPVPDQEHKESSVSSVYDILQQTACVRVAALAWLQALNHPRDEKTSSKEKVSHVEKAWSVWIMAPALPLKRLATALFVDPFHPSRWSWRRTLWCLKLSIGYIALFAMSVYWEPYANFELNPNDFADPVWSGWQAVAYAFSWQYTWEGTVKKGFQRILGTAFGGFSAWLGVIVCSWSYDDEAPINAIGLVAWLTVTTMLAAALFTVEAGLYSELGAGSEYGYTGIYFGLTQALIALQVYKYEGDRNGLTANRVFATVVGVAMAMLLSSIPPFVKGGDPQHVRDYLKELEKAFSLLLGTFVNDSAKIVDSNFGSTLLISASKRRRFALYLLHDASKFNKFPFCKVNEQLNPLIEDMFATESMIDHLNGLFAGIVSAEEEENLELVRGAVEQILPQVDVNKAGPDVEAVGSSGSNTEQVRLVVSFVSTICGRLKDHENALDQLQ